MEESQFVLYLSLGREHILDIQGYDHILFVMALCAVYRVRDWRRVLVLVTAFTIGHSITLALSTLRVVNVNSGLVELLIPFTILATAIFNVVKDEEAFRRGNVQLNYILAGVFGLIHGLGFSNYLRELLGKSSNIASQLFAFNLGLEFGQIVIVALFMFVTFIVTDIAHLKHKTWKTGVSLVIAAMSVYLIVKQLI